MSSLSWCGQQDKTDYSSPAPSTETCAGLGGTCTCPAGTECKAGDEKTGASGCDTGQTCCVCTAISDADICKAAGGVCGCGADQECASGKEVTSSGVCSGCCTECVPKAPAFTPKLTVLWIPVDWSGDIAGFDTEAKKQSDFLINHIPLKDCQDKYSGIWIDTICNIGVPKDWNTCYSQSDKIYKGINECGQNSGKKYDYIIGLTPEGLCGSRGYNFNGNKVIMESNPSDEGSTHELGHKWGLDDEYYDACRCFPSISNGYNCLNASLGGSDPTPRGGYTSAYCAGGNLCAKWGDVTCAGNKAQDGNRCIMGDYPNGGFCPECMAHLSTIDMLKC